MTNDGTFERVAIKARAQAYLLGGRVYDSVPDDRELERGASGAVKPYAVIHYGTIYAQTGSRSLVGEEEQPHVMPLTIECFAANIEAARASAGAVRDLFIGWAPSPGSAEIDAPGGSSYRDRNATGAPTLYIEAVALETIINLGSNDGSVPGPGDGPSGGSPQLETIESIVRAILGEQPGPNAERHDFVAPVGQWSIAHQLGRVPVVATYDMDGNRLLSDEQASATLVVVTWAMPQDGFAIIE